MMTGKTIVRRRAAVAWVGLVVAVATWAGSTTPARADPSQEDVFRSIQSSVGHSDSVSGKAMVGTLAVVAAVVIVAVIVTQRQSRRELAAGGWGSASSAGEGRSAGAPSINNHGKLVRELMREAGLTRAQVRQLEAVNDRLADSDRDVQHLATLLLCPSLIAAARPESIVQAA